MGVFLIALALLSGSNPIGAESYLREGDAATFRTAKKLPLLQRCLTQKLSQHGDVTVIAGDGMTTLMYRVGNGSPMLIDLQPPVVRVTTRFAYGTREIIKACT